MVFYIAQIHACHTMQKFGKALVPFCHRRTEFIAVYIKIIEQPSKATFRRRTLCRRFNMIEYTLQGFIQVFIVVCCRIHIGKQLRWQNEKSFFLHQTFTGFLCIDIAHLCIIKIRISSFLFTGIDIVCKIFRDVTVEHCAKHIVFEVPSVNSSSQFISDCPDRTMQLVTLLFFLCINHYFRSPFHQI